MNLQPILRPILRLILGLILIPSIVLPAAASVGPTAGTQVMIATTITVTTYTDELNDDGDCSLREAVQAANSDSAVDACPAGNGSDTITLPAGNYLLTLVGAEEDGNATGDLDLKSAVTINGAGAESTRIDAQRLDRVLHIFDGANVELNDLALSSGQTAHGGYRMNGSHGGGVFNAGTLTMKGILLTGNATGNGGFSGGHGGFGGGVYNAGELTINDSHLNGNQTGNGGSSGGQGGHGGAINNLGLLKIDNSAIEGNLTGFGGSGYDENGGDGGSGGGIFNEGTLEISNSTLSGNQTAPGGRSSNEYHGLGGSGGALFSSSKMNLNNVTMNGNKTSSGGSGGGLFNSGDGNILDSSLDGNYTENDYKETKIKFDGDGGGIANDGSLTISSSTFSGNHTGDGGYFERYGRSGGDGGAIANQGTMKVIEGAFFANHTGDGGSASLNAASGGSGGAIFNDGLLTISKSILNGNNTGDGGSSALRGEDGGPGGGIANENTITINESTISGNFTGSGGAGGNGGGIFSNGSATIARCTVNNNRTGPGASAGPAGRPGGSGGGIFADGSTNIKNSTISGNLTGIGGDGAGVGGGGGDGGGLMNEGGTLVISFSTIYGNQTSVGGGGHNEGSPGSGGGIENEATVILKNSIIFGNTDLASGIDSDDCSGTITTQGYNLTGVGTGCPTISSDSATKDAKMAALDGEGPDGGNPHTHALLPNSPALDAIPDGVNDCGTAIDEDQRGYARPNNGACDIGAYEVIISRTWDGGDGDWSAGANWSGDQRPEEGDHAVLDSAAKVSLDIGPSIGDLSISDAGANLSAGSGYNMLLNGSFSQSDGSFVAPPLLTIYGDWTRDGGSFNPNGGLVRFYGSGEQIIGGAADVSFHDMLINQGVDGRFLLDSPINISGDFTLISSNFGTQRNKVTFDGGSALDINNQESLTNGGGQQVVSGGPEFQEVEIKKGANVYWPVSTFAANLINNGSLQQIREVSGNAYIDFLDTGNYGGIKINANDAGDGSLDLGSTTVMIRGNQDCTNVAGETVKRCFTIDPENTSGLNATVSFFFDYSELSGNTCNDLNAYRWIGSDWVEYKAAARNCQAGLSAIAVSGIDQFSTFVLKSGGQPTAAALTEFNARSGFNSVFTHSSLITLAVVGLISIGGWRVIQSNKNQNNKKRKTEKEGSQFK